MATESKIKLFLDRVQQFEDLDKTSIYRPDLGTHSLEAELGNKINSMIDMLKVDKSQLDKFPDTVLQDIITTLQNIRTHVERERTYPGENFLTRRNEIQTNIDNQIDTIMIHFPYFKLAKIDDALLENLQRKDEQYDELLTTRLSDVDKISQSALGVALNQAQIDFNQGAKSNKEKALRWGGLAAILIIIFFVFVFRLMDFFKDSHVETQPIGIIGLDTSIVNQDSSIEIQPKEKISQKNSIDSQLMGKTGIELFYFTAIRITLLFTLGAIISFCLKMLRANLNLMERNAHKARLANSLEPLVLSAPVDQQETARSILIQEIASFGKTGLLQKEDDSILIVKNLLDTIAKVKQGSS